MRLDYRSVNIYHKNVSMEEWFYPSKTKRQALVLAAEDRRRLESVRRSRTGEKRVVLHAGILLDLASGVSDGAAARNNGVNRHTVALCARKVLQFGVEAALGELPRPGKSRRIPDDALRGYCIAPVRSRRNWAILTNFGPIRCYRRTCGSVTPGTRALWRPCSVKWRAACCMVSAPPPNRNWSTASICTSNRSTPTR